MRIVTTTEELREAIRDSSANTVGFVPTMGYLHSGHTTLFDRAGKENDLVVASIFVNPTQFGPGEDFEVYPRDPDGDAAKCRAHGVDLLFMPSVAEVYPDGHATTVTVDHLTTELCGRFRPGHFAGVATVVAKLFCMVGSQRAYFGEKDFQQLAVIRRMARDLNIPTRVIGVPTVREEDGLARSSRNVYLSVEERAVALSLATALRATRAAYRAGERSASALCDLLAAELTRHPTVALQYAELADPDSLTLLRGTTLEAGQGARAIIALQLGRTRLIDNAAIDHDDPSFQSTQAGA
jgi:pantoate--beta-alanine ligase